MTDKGHNQSDSGYANDPYGPHHRSATTTLIWSITLVLGVFVILAFFKKDLQMSLPSHLSPMLTTPSTPSSCDPPLPDLFSTSPPPSSHPKLIVASNAFQKQLEERFAQGGIDSIVLAVVTSEGSIFESTLGVVRANETDEEKKGKVTRDTVYRLASVSKVFNVLETLILRQRGLLSWYVSCQHFRLKAYPCHLILRQDPLTKFFPNFRYGPPSSSSSSRLPQQPITLHQLSCHLSGLGIIHPPGVVPNWPNDLKGSGHPPDNGNPFPSAQEVFDAVELYPKSAEGWAMTLYSNTGMGLLGMANVEAGLKGSGDEKRKASTVAELMRMDVFEPLGMERSGYEAGKYKVGEVAVSSVESKASVRAIFLLLLFDVYLKPIMV